MIKLKDLLNEQKLAGGRIMILATDTAAAPNKNTFLRFQQSHGTIQGDNSTPENKSIQSTGSPFKKQFQYITKTKPENDYLQIGNILINNQTNTVILTGGRIRQLVGQAEASGNGVYLLSRIINEGTTKLLNSNAVVLRMNGPRAGVQTIAFNASMQETTKKNSGSVLAGYCFVQAGLATPEFLESRDFAIQKQINYTRPVQNAPAFMPSLKDRSLYKDTNMISLGNNLANAVKSFVQKYKGQKMKPDSQSGKSFFSTPWRKSATADLVAMSKILSDTFKSRNKLFVDLKLQEFGAPVKAGSSLHNIIDSYWKTGPYEAKVATLFGPSKKGGPGGTSSSVSLGTTSSTTGQSGEM